jgi:hypothetical protein
MRKKAESAIATFLPIEDLKNPLIIFEVSFILNTKVLLML